MSTVKDIRYPFSDNLVRRNAPFDQATLFGHHTSTDAAKPWPPGAVGGGGQFSTTDNEVSPVFQGTIPPNQMVTITRSTTYSDKDKALVVTINEHTKLVGPGESFKLGSGAYVMQWFTPKGFTNLCLQAQSTFPSH